MDYAQYLKNLTPPTEPVDVILDTDTFNEIDDQFAIGYMLNCSEKLHVKGICAAPFFNHHSSGPADGMEKSYQEILKLLKLMDKQELESIVYRGSEEYLSDEQTPVISPAATFMAQLSKNYSPEKPLYIVAIGAITNVASAILLEPEMAQRCVVVWLGGHGTHISRGASEFNMQQDIAAARIIFGCGVPLVQLPCFGVVDRFSTSRYELAHWLKGKNPLCDYLYENTVAEAESYAAGKPWTRVIWDVTAVAWLMNQGEPFMRQRLIPSPIPQYDKNYAFDPDRHLICYVHEVDRDALFEALFKRLTA